MKVHHVLICFFFLSLQDGNTGLVNAQVITYLVTEGGNLTVQCTLSVSRSRKLLCKEDCKPKNILIDTTAVRAQSGRYSIEYREGTSTGGFLYVSITQLTKSDSGQYRCVFGSSFALFGISVVDAQLDENPAEVKTLHTRTGGDVLVSCYFTRYANRKYFCKDECEDDDILVETNGYRAQSGRYSIKYIEATTTGVYLYVSITQLTKSDSGWYRCALDKPFSPDLYLEFEINVTDDPRASTPSAVTPTPTTGLNSQSDEQETETPTDVWLYVGVGVAVMVLLLSLAVLIYCRKRNSKPSDPPGETEYASVTETNRVYENIREDRRNRSSPYAKYTKPGGAETRNDNSSVTQNTAEDNSSKLTYSELKFSSRIVGSPRSAPPGDSDNVVYSVPMT